MRVRRSLYLYHHVGYHVEKNTSNSLMIRLAIAARPSLIFDEPLYMITYTMLIYSLYVSHRDS